MSELCAAEQGRDCLALARAESLAQQVVELQAQNSASHRELFSRLNDLEKREAVQEVQYSTILEKLDVLTQKLDALESKPGKKWESFVEKILWAVTAAVIAFLLGRIGL